MQPYCNLEVVILQTESGYEASCEAFPKCVGIGENEKEALADLGDTIAAYVKSVAESSFKSVLLSDRYTEVVLDTSKETAEQTRVYNLDPTMAQMSRTLMLKIKPSQALHAVLPSENQNDITALVQGRETVPSVQIAQFSSLLEKLASQSDEGFAFGFPLSFN